MKSRIKLLVTVAGVGLFLGAFVWLLTRHGPMAPVGVQTTPVVRADLNPTVFGIGTVEARLSYSVGPVAPGRLLRVLVDQGEVVKEGQLLAEMDPVDLDRRVQSARSAGQRARRAVQAAEAQVTEAESRVKLARANQERVLTLHQQQATSSRDLDAARSESERAEASLAAARANAAAVSLDVERIDADLQAISSLRDSLRLVSPADGVIVSRDAEPGTTVVGGQAVLRLVVPKSLWVRARIDQSRAHGVQVGQPARIALRSDPGNTLSGRVARIELQSDPVTEERLVHVAFDAPSTRLYLGELAEVSIQLPGDQGVLTVPTAAVSRQGADSGIWREKGGRAYFSKVEFGARTEERAQVRSGLAEGDEVIVYSTAQLREGARIRRKQVGSP